MAARAVLDEFTAPAEKAALLERSRGRIEGLFGVSLAVLGALGAEEPLPARIWLQLRGAQEAVHSAKLRGGAQSLVAGPSTSLPTTSATFLSRGLHCKDFEPFGDFGPL
ncbi:Nedd4-Binding Protein 1 [Manis pentadactyla]|nr:Nedd4-Binding Protein 1 [Manis pentadactyla]